MASRFLQPYYLVNAALLVTYVPVRLLLLRPDPALAERAAAATGNGEETGGGLFQLDAYLGLPREFEILITLALYLAMQYRRARSIEGFVSTAITYSKLAVVLMAYFGNRTVFYWYVIIFSMLAILLQSPKFAWSEKVEEIDAEQAEALQSASSASGTASKKAKSKSVLLFCGVEGNQSCAEFVPSFSWLADKHASKNLTFARVDLGDNDETASKLKVQTTIESIQLPSMLLFQNGVEQRRLPPLDTDGNAVPAAFDKRSVEAYFSLADRSLGKSVSEPKNKDN
ncbi:Thioredoxin-related transmembrane protein 2 [Hondaea fermentalgiana]|uniref:Thioredoxin-related transmembrane protein 2 n=1 Tax=Hondaea fermentalgiana TaxID=2315210 RepID=A0A2R5GEE0_9STRA|nr:Thioredoxin-related transmembrane protein 2 [Hondaea fermentalgiana]|eukprot:GBG29317.1 Thioredoxin-related transmembrane protein 2 [Hondaea fermentalgiana]